MKLNIFMFLDGQTNDFIKNTLHVCKKSPSDNLSFSTVWKAAQDNNFKACKKPFKTSVKLNIFMFLDGQTNDFH